MVGYELYATIHILIICFPYLFHAPHSQKEGRRFFDLCHLGGDTHIYEQLLGCMFRISPDSFFQLNSPAAEVLYTVVREMVQEVDPHTLLDVGCGTGDFAL